MFTCKSVFVGLVEIEPEWLPIFTPYYCTYSKPLDDPAPTYDKSKGHVVCHMSGTFSRCTWSFPAVELEYPYGLDRYKWFAKFLLEGVVCKKLKQFVPSLLSSPSTMVKSWSK